MPNGQRRRHRDSDSTADGGMATTTRCAAERRHREVQDHDVRRSLVDRRSPLSRAGRTSPSSSASRCGQLVHTADETQLLSATLDAQGRRQGAARATAQCSTVSTDMS